MRSKYIFHHDHYYHTLKNQIGSGIPVFHGARQRGGGIGSIFGGIAKYALPLIAKYILPHAKTAATNVISNIVNKRGTIKESLKNSGVQLINDIGNSIITKQAGEGLVSRGIKRKSLSTSTNFKKSKQVTGRNKKRKTKRNKLDIFD
jgi:hypothetical protein